MGSTASHSQSMRITAESPQQLAHPRRAVGRHRDRPRDLHGDGATAQFDLDIAGAGAGVDAAGVSVTGTNCGKLAACLAGTAAELGAGRVAATSSPRASLRQPCTMFAFNPCDIATFATDAHGAAHCSNTNALNCALCRLRETTLSSAIVSTYFLDGHDR